VVDTVGTTSTTVGTCVKASTRAAVSLNPRSPAIPADCKLSVSDPSVSLLDSRSSKEDWRRVGSVASASCSSRIRLVLARDMDTVTGSL